MNSLHSVSTSKTKTIKSKSTTKPPTKNPAKPKKIIPPDYFIVFSEGYLDKGSHLVYRAQVSTDKGITPKVGEVRVKSGYGQTKQKAIENFITENDSFLLDKIFDIKD